MATNRFRIVDQNGNIVGTVAQDSIITGPDGTQATVTANGLKVDGSVKITATDVMVPTDKQAVYRTRVFLDTTPVAAGASRYGSAVECSTMRRLVGFAAADQAFTVEFQQSEDGSYWYTLDQISVSANGRTKYDVTLVAPYVRYKIVGGGTGTTWTVLTGYLQAE